MPPFSLAIGGPMTDREWRAVADELERMANDFESAEPGFRDSTADALVIRIRMVIEAIRAQFVGH